MSNLCEVIGATLIPHGFKKSKRGRQYVRAVGDMCHIVEVVRSRKGSGLSRVTFSITKAGVEQGRWFDISHVAPFKNTYWWSDDPSPSDLSALIGQIELVVLPFFHGHSASFDVESAHAKVYSCLDNLLKAEPPFVKHETTYWRCRGSVIDVVDVEFLGNSRFAFVHASVWHKSLISGAENIPEDASRVTFRTIGPDGLEEALTNLYYLGPAYPGTITIESPTIASIAVEYFGAIKNRAAVLARIRPEYRHMFPVS